jgi:hypothetical protein
VLPADALTDEQAEWGRRGRHREREWFADRLGLQVELRAEGALAIDPDDELTDTAFPAGGSARHLALLLLEALVARLRPAAREAPAAERGWRRAGAELVAEVSAQVLGEWRGGLKREHREHPAVALAEAERVLIDFGLVRPEPDGARLVHAAAARYAVHATLAEPGEGP